MRYPGMLPHPGFGGAALDTGAAEDARPRVRLNCVVHNDGPDRAGRGASRAAGAEGLLSDGRCLGPVPSRLVRDVTGHLQRGQPVQ